MKLGAACLVVGAVLAAGCGARSVLDDVGYGLVVDGGANDSSVTGDGSPGDAAPVDAGRDVTPVPIGSLVPCGTENCFPSTEECCVPLTPGGHPACALKGKCMGISLSCTSSKQCAMGDVCCVGFGGGGGGGGIGATCQAMCGGGPGGGGLQLCSSSQECPSGELCVPTPFGVSVCLAPGGGGRDGGGGGGGGMRDAGGGIQDASGGAGG